MRNSCICVDLGSRLLLDVDLIAPVHQDISLLGSAAVTLSGPSIT